MNLNTPYLPKPMTEHLAKVHELLTADRNALQQQIDEDRAIFKQAFELLRAYLRDSTKSAKARKHFAAHQQRFGTLFDSFNAVVNAIEEKHSETAKLNSVISHINIVRASVRELLK
jgi:hypothetical protein